MKKNLFTLFAFFIVVNSFAQVDSITKRIFLIGDAGELNIAGNHPVVDWLKKNIDWNDERNLALFLGDNIYPLGLPSEGEATYEEAKRIIDSQIDLVKGKNSKAYFIPGNHDWKNGKIGGWLQVTNQINYINSQLLNNVEAWPREGCPGPIEVEVDSSIIVVLMDSQWFLHVHEKPEIGSTCTSKSLDEFTTQLHDIAQSHPNQLLVLAMHHPIHTVGAHGGAYRLRHHIFPLAEAVKGLYIPLPIIGSIYPIARGIFGNIQDVNHPAYRAMSKAIDEVIQKHPNVIVAAGHDHSLQLLRKDSVYHIVSGSAAKTTRVQTRKNNDVIFTDVNVGFAVIEVSKSGKVEIKFYTPQSKNYSAPTFVRAAKTIERVTPRPNLDSLKALPDYVQVAANPKLEGSGFKNFLLGKNYRNEWTQKITVPVLDIGKEYGGLTPMKQGGGKQTKSLRLEDKNGKEWVLRTVEKFPEAAIPADLRQTFAKDIVSQGISASYPFGSLSVTPLTEALGLPTLRRKIVYVPDDPRLDRFRVEFANTLAILEEREPINIKKTDNTDELILKLAKDNDDHIDHKRVLQARLLDNFIMDFDRHEDQWRWATYDTGKGKMYYPIPRDHDQVFFVNQGLLPYFARKPWYVPELQGFGAKAKDINTFNRPARNFDRFFLTELNAEDWSNQIDTFLSKMTDQVIDESLHRQPIEIQKYSMPEIIKTLKERRQYFREEMMEYYRFISKEVNVVGSNQREQFTITGNNDNSVTVKVNKIDKDSVISSLIYDRTFDPDVTEELRLYGLSDDDVFKVEGGDSKIKIRIIGGPGNDEFINNGSGKNVLLYDATFEENRILGNPGFKNRFSSDPQVNRYNRLGYKYNFFNPGTVIAFNVDDGMYIGAELEITRQGFRKEPYKSRHYLQAIRAFETSSYRFKYEADYIKVLGNHDLLIRADLRAPVNVTNYFGIGNETVYDKNKPGAEQYYRSRYDFADVSILMRKQLQSWMRINYGPTFQYFRVEESSNQGKFVSETGINGLDPTTLYKAKAFAGGHFKLDINSTNNKAIPTRGLIMDFNVRPIVGLNEYSNNLLRLDVDIRIFASLFSLPRLVLATRLGYGRIYGNYDFPQAYYLSGTENLRGYRRNRFAGRSMFFNNTELRFKAANFNTYLFAGSLGFLVFNDVGRVWANGQSSTDWHVGNGAGIWLAPVNRFVIAAMVTRSKEEKFLPLVTFGFQF